MESYNQDLVAHLSQFVTVNRLELFKRVMSKRTRYLTILLEDIYQSQNASAVLRSCDCLGIQDVHIVEDRNQYEVNPDVALGSDQWLTLHYYNSSKDSISIAIKSLKKKGYRIVATTPHRAGATPETFSLEAGKSALLFGTELNGLTDTALELADEYIQIPMVGFTESYNISVSAAIILSRLRIRLEDSSIKWRLQDEETVEIMLKWLRASIKMAGQIEDKFLKTYDNTF